MRKLSKQNKMHYSVNKKAEYYLQMTTHLSENFNTWKQIFIVLSFSVNSYIMVKMPSTQLSKGNLFISTI